MGAQDYGLVCVNGHAMDDGYLECPCCGAYRPPGILRPGMTHRQQMDAIRRALMETPLDRQRRILRWYRT